MAYPFSLGGGEKRNWEIGRRLAARGHEVSLLCVKMWEGEDEIVRDGARYAGVCPWSGDLSVAGKRAMGEPLFFGRHVYAHLKAREYDVVDCSNFPYLSCIAAERALAGKGNSRLVVTWYEIRGFRRWLRHRGWKGLPAWFFERVVSRLTCHNVAISDFTAARAERKLGIRGIKVVPCGVDTALWRPDGAAAVTGQVLYVGRLTRHKNVDMLITAFAETARSVGDCTLKIVGRGIERNELERLALETCPKGRVVFADSLSEDELRAEYAKSSVFVLPSEQEGFGMVLLEAMAAGAPVVALDSPDSAAGSLIRNGENGMLVRTGPEMASAMRSLLEDPALRARVRTAGAETAARYDWDSAVVTPLEEYYRDVCRA